MLVMNYFKTCKEVILRPSDFFRRMPKTGGYREPLRFAVISTTLGLLLSVIVNYGLLQSGTDSKNLLEIGMLFSIEDFSDYTLLIDMIAIICIGIFIIFLNALILNFLYKRFGGTGNYEGLVRVLSYSCALNLLTWVPILNIIIIFYEVYLCGVGGAFVQNVSKKRSIMVVILSYLLFLVLFLLIEILIVCFIIFMSLD